jgi:hypothetical protein
MAKKYFKLTITWVCIMISFIYAVPGLAISQQNLYFYIYNYQAQALTYITQDVIIGQLDLPTSISEAPSGGGASVANGLINSGNTSNQAIGSFKIGIDSKNYCEFYYDINASLPIRVIRSTGQLSYNCSIDPDSHRYIIINNY